MAACKQWFWTEDGDGNSMSVNVQFDFYELKSGEWVYGGSYTIPAGGSRTLDLDNTKKYKAVPHSISGYATPPTVEFFGCVKDVTFVYIKTGAIGEIINVSYPSTSKSGDDVTIRVQSWNKGDVTGTFQVKLYDSDTGGIVHTFTQQTLAPDASINELAYPYPVMPSKNWNLIAKLYVGGKTAPDDTESFTIGLETVIENGFTIRVSNALATKTVHVAHVVKIFHPGPEITDPNLWYWPAVFDYVGGKWYMVDPATAYRVEVGSIFETIPSFDKTYGTGSFADEIHCVVLAEGASGVNTSIFKGEDVFQLFADSPTEINLSSTSNDIISEAIMGPVCDIVGIPRGDECSMFWAEFADPVFVANYVCIKENKTDLLGNPRELTAFDKIALPFAILGSLPGLNLLPFGVVITKGLAAVSKTGAKFGDAAVQFMLSFTMDAANKISSKDTWYFLDAIGQVTEAHATEIVNALTAGDTTLANTLLRKYAGESKGWWDYHALNDLLRDALPTDAYNWLRTQIGLTEIGAGTVMNTAKQATLSADDIAKLADAAKDSGVMDEVAKSVRASFNTVDNIVDPVKKAQKLNDLKNIEETIPQAFVGVVDDATASLTQKLSKTGSEIVNAMPIAPASSWDEAADTTALVFDNVLEGLKTKREMLEDPDMFYAFTTFVRDTCVWIVRATAKFDEPLSATYARMMRVAEGVRSSIKEVPETITAMADSEVDTVRAAMIRAFGDITGNKIIDDAYQLTKFGKGYIQKLLDVLYAGGRLTDSEVTEILTKSSSRETIDEVFEVLDAVSGGDPAVDAALSAKLRGFGGTEKVLGDVLGAKARYFDVVPDSTLDEFVGFCVDDAKIGLKALDSVDPAKMSDIPHAAIEAAAKADDIIDEAIAANPKVSKVRAEDIIFGLGRNVGDDIREVTQVFADEVPTNWFTKARQRAAIIPNRIKAKWAGLERYEKVLCIWFMVDNVAFIVYMIAKFLGLGPGDRGFAAWNLAKSVTDAKWLCKESCEDKRYGDLESDIVILEGAITDLEDYLDKYEFSLKLSNSYDAPNSVLSIGKSSLKLMQECLVNRGIVVAPSTGKIVFFAIDSNRQAVIAGAYVDGWRVGTIWGSGLEISEVDPGSYDLEVKASGYIGCTKTVNVVALQTETFECTLQQIGDCSPVTDVKIYIDPLSPVTDEIVSFNGSAKSNDPITSWEWKFGDGFTATGQAVTHPYSSEGIYTVELKVTNDCEESTTSTRNVTVSEEEPPIESTTLTIERMVDTSGVDIPRYWEVEIWVDEKYTKCQGPQTLTFGTNEYCDCESPWYFVPCELGTHTITLKKSGYDDKSVTVYMEKDTPKTWPSPVMVLSTAPPQQRTISLIVPVGSNLYVDGNIVT